MTNRQAWKQAQINCNACKAAFNHLRSGKTPSAKPGPQNCIIREYCREASQDPGEAEGTQAAALLQATTAAATGTSASPPLGFPSTEPLATVGVQRDHRVRLSATRDTLQPSELPNGTLFSRPSCRV